MLEASTRIYVRDPKREDNLIPGIVSEVIKEKVVVRYLQPIALLPGVKTQVLFYNQHNCFTTVPCQLQRMLTGGQSPTGALILTGDPEVAENRNSYRVSINDGTVGATVNDEDKAEVINLSCEGLAALLDTEAYQVDQWVNITLHDACGDHPGRVQVRGRSCQTDGRFRYGLMADPDEAGLISQLARIKQEQQRVKSRRAQGIGVNNKAANQASNENQDPVRGRAENTADDVSEETDVDSHGSAQRRATRTPWPGMAKVYVREDSHLRVLDIEVGDLSRGGISFLCPRFIHKDREALFEKPIGGGFFRVRMMVRNVMLDQDGKHRVGAQFIDGPLKPGEMPPDYTPTLDAA